MHGAVDYGAVDYGAFRMRVLVPAAYRGATAGGDELC